MDTTLKFDEPYGAGSCGICGERLGDEAQAEVVEVATETHLLVHAEPCSYEHGDKYVYA